MDESGSYDLTAVLFPALADDMENIDRSCLLLYA